MEYVQMFLAGMIGVILHALIKVQAINKRMDSQTYQTVLAAYWKSDWPTFFISVVVVVGCVFVSSEVLTAKTEDLPKGIADVILYRIQNYIKLTFIAIGFCADSLLYLWLGRAEKTLKKKVEDEKLNDEENK